MPKTTRSTTVTTVREVYSAFGRTRENPPSLAHLRHFVGGCEGLPDNTPVRIEFSSLDEGGRRTVIMTARHEHPQPDPDDDEDDMEL